MGICQVKKIVHYHIEKTGGMSIQRAIPGGMFSRWVFPMDCPDQYRNIRDRGRTLRYVKSCDLLVVEGGADQVGIQELVGDRFSVTFLRDPVARVISWVNYQQHMGIAEVGDDMLQFLVTHANVTYAVRDRMVRQLGGRIELDYAEPDFRDRKPIIPIDELFTAAKARLEDMSFVGFTETMNADQSRLWKMIGLDSDAMSENVMPQRRVETTSEAVEYIQSLTEWDQKLYDWAREQYV